MARIAASSIAILLFAGTGAARGVDRPRLRVLVLLEFAGPAPPAALTRALKSEAAARWTRYGVAIAWNRPNACDAADLSVGVVVERGKGVSNVHDANLVLGVTRIDSEGNIGGPIAISEPATRAILAAREPEFLGGAAMFPGGVEAELGRALGRVLAHELGHILLAAPYHRATGLMRARFPASDLGALNPGPFGLEQTDVARLRNRLPVILAGLTTRPGDC